MRALTLVAGVDRTWQGDPVVIAIGPVAVPSAGALRAAIRRLGEHPAATRLDRTASAAGRWWRPVPAGALDRCVHELPPFGDRARLLHEASRLDRGGCPFAFVLSGDVLVLAIDHVLGDGYYMTRLLAAAAELASTGEVPEWVAGRPARRPLTRALWQQFGREPRRLRALADHARTARRPARTPQALRPWRPSPAVVVRCSGTGPLRELKAWRRSHASGVSTIPLAIAAAELAHRSVGVPTAGPPLVLFDARRHLRPDGADVGGNFCAGLRLELVDPGDPVAVDAAIKQAVALGRPLAVTAAAAVTSLFRPRPAVSVAPAAPAWDVAWDIAYTHMGKPPELARLTRGAGARASYVGLLPPSGPSGVTFAMSEIGDQLNVSVSFHDNVLDPAAVAAVTDRLVTDPAGLLEAHRTTDLQEPPL